MSTGQRPGGLTALAILNFVFGGLGALMLLGLAALLTMAEVATEGGVSEAMSETPNAGLVWVSIFIGIVVIALLIISGVGYLGQKRVLGRGMGNAYGIVALASVALNLTVQPFNIGTIVSLVYPVLTLILINTTFKDDLVN